MEIFDMLRDNLLKEEAFLRAVSKQAQRHIAKKSAAVQAAAANKQHWFVPA